MPYGRLPVLRELLGLPVSQTDAQNYLAVVMAIFFLSICLITLWTEPPDDP